MPLWRWFGAIAIFLGTLLAIVGINRITFVMGEMMSPHVDAIVYPDYLPHYLERIEQAAIAGLLGVALYLIGRRLRPGPLSQFGMMFTAIAVIWSVSAGACYYERVDHLGLQRGLIALAYLVGALIGAIGQTLRVEFDDNEAGSAA